MNKNKYQMLDFLVKAFIADSDDSGTSKSKPACTVLGINVRDFNKQAAQDFVKDNDITYPSIYVVTCAMRDLHGAKRFCHAGKLV